MVVLKRRHIRLASPPGQEVLFFFRMVATERLGRMFQMEVECLSNDHKLKLEEVVGKEMTVEMDMKEGSDEIRYFHGFVSKFSYLGHFEGHGHYKATLRPWLWFLTRKQDSRIFQNKKVPDIIEEVFKEINGFDNFERNLRGEYREWEYCVQYRETDFNFVSRLMEQEGIYYYFKHEKNKHIVVLSDDTASHDPYPGYEELKFYHAEEGGYRRKGDHIWEWKIDEEAQSGQVVLDDFDFIKPSAELMVKSALSARSHPHAKIEVFDYPGIYTETQHGDAYARVRLEEHSARYERLHGAGNARGLSLGHLFSLEAPQAPDWREEQNRKYLITAATHSLKLEDDSGESGFGDSYTCWFEAMHSEIPFRPPRITPKPTVRGIQTAIVVGKKGEEIWTDKYGRIKIHFHWDRYNEYDETASCWVRVAQIWAGKNWGGMYIPRTGQEVVVDFLEGDPDRPLVIGRVYNDNSMPPYDLPDNATISTVKSNSSKGGGGFNEFRIEDKKGEEQIFIHAERTQHNRVKDSSFEWVGKDRHTIIVENQYEQVDKDKHLTVTGDQNENVDGTVSLTAGADLQQKVTMNAALDAGSDIHIKAGMNMVLEAGIMLTLKVPGSFIVLDSSGVKISGPMVLINSGGSAGSGSGASPDAALPPEEAVTAEPGEVDKYSGPKVTRKKGSNPTATGLQAAAEAGTPFCEQCEAQRAQSQS